MNKQIFELIQAQNGFRGLLWSEEDKREFAELIVGKCIDIAYRNNNSGEGGYIAENIKQDFGIEE